MRAPSWLAGGDETRARALLLLPLRLLSWLYGLAAWLHRALYAHGWLPRRRLPCRVVSVGSLVVGGAGKTPMAAWLAASLQARGYRVALATRGYGRRGREAVSVISDGHTLASDANAVGDEPIVLARQAPGVPVLVARDRGLAGLTAVSEFATDVLVLDDGFQHHRLERDVDILCLDGSHGLGNGFVLPRGPLREWPRAIASAAAVCVLDGPLADTVERRLSRHLSSRPAARRERVRRRPGRLCSLAGGEGEGPEALRGRQVGVFCGLARPESLVQSIEALGASVVARRFLPDHHRHRSRDLRGLALQTSTWITSEKDAVKIDAAWLASEPGLELRVLTLELEIEQGPALLDWLEERLALRPARGRAPAGDGVAGMKATP